VVIHYTQRGSSDFVHKISEMLNKHTYVGDNYVYSLILALIVLLYQLELEYYRYIVRFTYKW